MSDTNQEAKTPLIDLLRNVPAQARMSYAHSPTHYQMIPVGRLCADAASALAAAKADNSHLRAALEGVMPFAIAYAGHPVRNPKDRLDESIAAARAALKGTP